MTALEPAEPRHYANLTHKHTVCGQPRGEVYEASRRRDVTCPACADVLDAATRAGGAQGKENAPPGPATHPNWCERTHGEMPRHEAQIGGDLELDGGTTFAVYLAQREDEPAEVELLQHTADETSMTGLSILQAAIFRDLLGEALGLVAREAGL